MFQHTWSSTHPHAGHKQWQTFDGHATLTWTWQRCFRCGCKTAAVVGATGRPVCDACWEAIAPRLELEAPTAEGS